MTAPAAIWRAFCAATDVDPETPYEAWSFGDSPAMADELAGLVVHGPKRATAGLLAEYEAEGEAIAEVGQLSVITDGRGRGICVIRTTEVRILAYRDVDQGFAWEEGEGDRSLAHWRAVHERFFRRSCARIGVAWHPGLEVVCERFQVVWPPESADG